LITIIKEIREKISFGFEIEIEKKKKTLKFFVF